MAVRVRYLDANGVRLAVHEWGTPGARPLVCVPGSALPAELFCGIEPLLADHFHGFTVDRRGHGLSEKASAGYDFTDFRDDLIAVLDALGIESGIALGHSAGGTDMLLAAAARPRTFDHLVIMEPTVQDPRIPPLPLPVPDTYEERLSGTLRKYTTFPSLQAAYDRWRPREPWSRTREPLFRTYLTGAFETREDGAAHLLCGPQLEVQMLQHIVKAMNHHYSPPSGEPDPFAAFPSIATPVTLVRMQESGEIYGKMADIAADILPQVERIFVDGAGHLLPLEQPEYLADLVRSRAG